MTSQGVPSCIFNVAEEEDGGSRVRRSMGALGGDEARKEKVEIDEEEGWRRTKWWEEREEEEKVEIDEEKERRRWTMVLKEVKEGKEGRTGEGRGGEG